MTTLVTWNCNMAFRKKQDKILQYDPDILVIQECENPDTKGEWSAFSDWRWIGENEHKGLGVFTRNGISLQPAAVAGYGGRFTLPITTDESIDVLGVWAMNDKQNPRSRYIGQVYTAVQEYREFIDSDTVVAGDFNWNAIWDDSPNSPLCGDFSDTVDRLDDYGLRSVYHMCTASDYGSETDPTFFMHKRCDRQYHIDYIFLPEKMRRSVTDCTVGTYEEWVDTSDHMPVIVKF